MDNNDRRQTQGHHSIPNLQPESAVWFRERALQSHEIIVSLTADTLRCNSLAATNAVAHESTVTGRESNRTQGGSTFKEADGTGNGESDDDEDEPATQPDDDINEIYTAFSEGYMIKGILCPSLTNSFHSPSLERSYLTYSHRQRQKSLIIVNVVDMLVKIILAVVYVWRKNPPRVS